MKIKRFFAPDVRQAMRMVRDQLGEDAVILSNKRVNGGVEIISAIDYDESIFSQESTLAKTKHDMNAQGNPINHIREPDVSVESSMPAKEKQKPQVVWSQEPTLVEMRSEIKMLRGLLETQLASLADKEEKIIHPFQYELSQRMAWLGFGSRLTRQLINELPDEGSIDELWRRLLGKIATRTTVTDDDILTHGGVVALIGPTGVGKTTTVAKLAARYAMRHGSRSVALISTDNYRIGAHEQIKAYSRILDIPIRFAENAEGLQAALDYFCDKRLVLIDTAGMSQRDLRLTQQFSMFEGEYDRIKTYLVISATSRLSGLEEIVQRFSGIKPRGCILTKADESTSIGHALDVVIQHQIPMAYISDGQRVPEDLQPARPHTLVSRSVAIMEENAALLDDEFPGMRVGEAAW